MKNKIRPLIILALTLVGVSPAFAAAPLKVYILAGQSNMDGQAKTRTINAMRDDPEVAELYQKMTDKDGNPITVEDVHIVHNQRSGKLDATFGSALRGPKIGPEYAFGIRMKESVKEPILLIKTAWGGKDLIQQFRPPSGGDFEKETDKHGNKTGHFYRRMIKEVNAVLADPGKYHPAYDKEAGYEIAGFVWFQGFNDQFGPYPKIAGDRNSVKDFSEYGRLLACLIRDARKDLSAPEMKVVIGAVGIDGVLATEHEGIPGRGGTWVSLQRAQAAPAAMPGFKDTVSVVYTAKYWDHKLAAAAGKMKWVNKKLGLRIKDGTLKERGSPKADAMRARYMQEKNMTEEEVKLMKGVSDGAYHYLGSAKIYSRIGEAFAESMLELEKQ